MEPRATPMTRATTALAVSAQNSQARIPPHTTPTPPTPIQRFMPMSRSPARSCVRVESEKVVEHLAAHDHPDVAVAHEEHRGPRHLVVVRGHRMAVGTGDRGGQDIPHGEVGG